MRAIRRRKSSRTAFIAMLLSVAVKEHNKNTPVVEVVFGPNADHGIRY
jgi:hypothetical protein